MIRIPMLARSIVLLMLLASLASADPDGTFTIYADSTLAGIDGVLMSIVEAPDSGYDNVTVFFTIENGRLRFVGVRPYGEDAWELMPEGGYFAPGPDDEVGDSFTTVPDDFGRPSHCVVDGFETMTTSAGTFEVVRCSVRPDEAPEEITEYRYFAAGVGMVAQVWPNEAHDVMIAYDVADDTAYFPLDIGNTWDYVYLDVGTAVGEAPAAAITLHTCVPNPFNPRTSIAYEMAVAGHASLRIYDTAGRLVRTLIDEQRPAGAHAVVWDGRDATGRVAAAGVYLYRLEAGGEVRGRTMTLVK